jgi:hypothetical protein
VVGHVLQVVVLQGHEKADEDVARNLELLHQVALLSQKKKNLSKTMELWSSLPPQGLNIAGSNPAVVLVALLGIQHCYAVVHRSNVHCCCVNIFEEN